MTVTEVKGRDLELASGFDTCNPPVKNIWPYGCRTVKNIFSEIFIFCCITFEDDAKMISILDSFTELNSVYFRIPVNIQLKLCIISLGGLILIFKGDTNI